MAENSPAKRGNGPGHGGQAKGPGRGGPASGRPAEAFTEGNLAAATHQAYATIARQELDDEARAILDALAADAPLRGPTGELPAADGVAVKLLASALIRLRRCERWVAENDLFDDDGELRPVADLERRLRAEALDCAEALGMTPRSRAKLGLDLAQGLDLARQWAEEGDDVIEGEASDDG